MKLDYLYFRPGLLKYAQSFIIVLIMLWNEVILILLILSHKALNVTEIFISLINTVSSSIEKIKDGKLLEKMMNDFIMI